MAKRLWLIRLGRYGEREEAALEQNMISINFGLNGDLSAAKDRDAILEHVKAAHSNAKIGTQRNYAAQVNQFVNRMQVGDIVVSPLKKQGGIAIGEVTGPYEQSGSESRTKRPVRWLQNNVPRDTFKQDLLYSFGSIMTVCEVRRNDALNRVLSVAEHGIDPGFWYAPDLPDQNSDNDDTEADASTQPVDLAEIARNQIEARISSIFTGHDFTNLVAAILEARGYYVCVSPPGPDAGCDIVAGRGALGFDSPRLVVQVKSGNIVVDHPTLQSLNGLIQDTNADHGLIVSWSGFKSSVRKETNRQYFRVRFWGRDEVIEALLSVYDDLPERIRVALPLKRIWTLVPGEDEDAG